MYLNSNKINKHILKTLLEHWLKENKVSHKLILHKKKGQLQELCICLGNDYKPCSLNKQIVDNISPPTIYLPKNLEPTIMYAHEEIPGENDEVVKNLEPAMIYVHKEIPVENDEVAKNNTIEKNDNVVPIDNNIFIEIKRILL